MNRTASSWDHRLLFKIAIFGGLSQLLLIPFFIMVGNLFDDQELPSGDLLSERQAEDKSQPESYQIHDSSGELDAQLLLEANVRATYGNDESGLRSLVMRGTLSLGNGEVADFSLMRRDDGKIREIVETTQIRIEYTSDGETVWRLRSRNSFGQMKEDEPVGDSQWYQARMALGMPLGSSYSGDVKVSASRDAEGVYGITLDNAGTQQELRLDAQTFLISKSRMTKGGITYDLGFSDYSDIAGVRLPHRIDIDYSDGRFPERIVVESYQINPGLLPSLFTP